MSMPMLKTGAAVDLGVDQDAGVDVDRSGIGSGRRCLANGRRRPSPRCCLVDGSRPRRRTSLTLEFWAGKRGAGWSKLSKTAVARVLRSLLSHRRRWATGGLCVSPSFLGLAAECCGLRLVERKYHSSSIGQSKIKYLYQMLVSHWLVPYIGDAIATTSNGDSASAKLITLLDSLRPHHSYFTAARVTKCHFSHHHRAAESALSL